MRPDQPVADLVPLDGSWVTDSNTSGTKRWPLGGEGVEVPAWVQRHRERVPCRSLGEAGKQGYFQMVVFLFACLYLLVLRE